MEPTTPETSPRHPKFVRWALLLGIVVVLNIFFTVVIALAFPSPQFENYCPVNTPSPADAATCDASGGIWTEYPVAPSPSDMTKPTTTGYCDMYAKCQKPYNDAMTEHSLYAFMLMTGLGVLALVAGLFPIGSSIVSSGLSYGGVLALVIGSAQYWGEAGNWLRLGITSIGLLVLLYIAWKRFRD